MSLFSFFKNEEKPSSAARAKERLQVVIAHERGAVERPDYLPQLQRDLLEVIKKYVDISEDKLDIKVDCIGGLSTLEVNVELPDS
ncbi:cell division topological specificity factor MinE [Desulfotalea psychrophila]|uniref:Cell division topological specificity factor n=1 Tax=Desulfotalea psychrophila (strain LSv54 / DSM 12343) TaxID=177439 RepID=MINE_DESPS|nr:cell division topological specificity factor MinE [Desulfotalea psychrophila]Q6AQH6.1 RecName: Full=Cell division topological specificity factor [Desulfotalea psychrophila LSv54]CAG35397.1 probable cell division topological specificity factor (MinE) [Desulfotalea psychrophila LSv54]